MPHCSNCGRGQTKLNEGGFCRSCFNENKINENLSQKVAEATTEDDDNDYWKKMEKLLETKLAIQKEKIKKAVTGKLADLTKRQYTLEEENKKIIKENKSLAQRITTLETRQKNVEQDSQKIKSNK